MFLSGWLIGCRIEANYPLMGLGPTGGMPSVGFFLRDPIPYLRQFRRKPWKNPSGQVDKLDQGLNLAPLIYQSERRTVQPLVGQNFILNMRYNTKLNLYLHPQKVFPPIFLEKFNYRTFFEYRFCSNTEYSIDIKIVRGNLSN